MSDTVQLSTEMTQQQVADVVASFKQGNTIAGLELVDAGSKIDDLVSQGAQISKPLILGDDLLFVQPDGRVIGLIDGAKSNVLLTADKFLVPVENLVSVALQQADWDTIADAFQVNLAAVSTAAQPASAGSGSEEPVLPSDPLLGLEISPLLPPTDYLFPDLRERDFGADDGDSDGSSDGGIGLPDVQINGGSGALIETDGALDLQFAQYFQVVAGGAAVGEEITSVSLTLPGLPIGTVASAGTFSTVGNTLTYSFVGSLADYNALSLSFPKDFATDTRTDVAPGDLQAIVSATSNFLGTAQSTVSISVEPEGDLDFTGPGVLEQDETDGPVSFILGDALRPQANDEDGSESVTSVDLTLSDLPVGARISTDGGISFTTIGTQFTFNGSLSDYNMLVLELPGDFSTTNPSTDIRGVLQATTDEGADETREFTLVVNATQDIVIRPPATVTGVEDGAGADGSGVTVDLDLDISVEDVDGSEDLTRVEIVFQGLPLGATLSNGVFSAGSARWVGTMAEANALQVTLPGDYSGTFSSVITAENVEGSQTATQTVVISPAGDVDIAVTPIEFAETDAPLVVNPSASWVVSVSDNDPSAPFETLETITLTLNDLPPGVLAQNVPASTITYDTAAGGALTFTGTASEYALLRLVIATDFSSESPLVAGGEITGTISATSNEGQNGPVGVALRITPEGDAALEVLPLVPFVEANNNLGGGTVVQLRDVMTPSATDLDSSEAISELTLEIKGLPGAPFSLGSFTGLPAGVGTLTLDAATNTNTFTATLNSGNIPQVFRGITFQLPADFSTANRSDLATGTTLPLEVNVSITTDEDADLSVDSGIDGQVTAQSFITIDAEADIELNVPVRVDAQEDGGVQNASTGVNVPLGITVAITDLDGSESAASTGPFATQVTIEFRDLPPGASLTTGTLVGTQWTGSVADANALAIDFPPDYAGVVLTNVTVTTPEGSESSPSTIIVAPTPDVNISGSVFTRETDADVTVLLSDFINLTINPANEILSSLQFTLPNLPANTRAVDLNGQAVGSITPDGNGTFVFAFDTTTSPTVDPATISLIFPQDFSTQNPALPLEATLVVISVQPPFPPNPAVTAQIGVTIEAEGDLRINKISDAVLQETDAPVDFRPVDFLQPEAFDLDNSESIQSVGLTFNALPTGSLFSIDGVTFAAAPPTLNFLGSEAEYQNLIIRLPADFSTTSPGSQITGTIVASTDEVGVATDTFDVSVSEEGDIAISGPLNVTLIEKDNVGVIDVDATPEGPQLVRLSDVITAQATDADGSETINSIQIGMSDLPPGARISLDDGVNFIGPFVSGSVGFNVSNLSAYEDVLIEVPADFSTDTAGIPIGGSVTFRTDEGGLESASFTVEITAEADVRITGQDITIIEDLGAPVALGQTVAVTDADGSESISSVSITFDGLSPNGPTTLSDGTVLTPGSNVWTGTAAQIAALEVVSFPTHFSGIVTMTTNVVTNESGPAGQSSVFLLRVTPVAEPVISLSLDATDPNVMALGPDQFTVKEDATFTLNIDASTPDQDGSESLRDVVIENVPTGWLRAGDGPIAAGQFVQGGGDVASASITGTTLTIALNPGVTVFDGALTVTLEPDSDADGATLTGDDLLATVTAVDTATGLAAATEVGLAPLNIDVDAVIDPIVLETRNRSANENQNNVRNLDAGITALALNDVDGSENFQSVTFRLDIETLSTDIDAAIAAGDFGLNFRGLDAFVSVSRVDSSTTDQALEYVLTKPAGVSNADFASAVTSMRVIFPEAFSGRATLDGTVNWAETALSGAEFDLSDNQNSQSFTNVLTVRPLAQAVLDTGVFVNDANFAVGATTDIANTTTAGRNDSSVVNGTTLTLKESTADATGPGQVQAFVRIDAQTADLDGSESLQQLVISNVPSSWIGIAETTQDVPLTRASFFDVTGTNPIAQSEFDKIATAQYTAATGEVEITLNAGVTSFAGAIALYPALYEDYDIDRLNTDSFTSDGLFFGSDLNVRATVQDGNTLTTVSTNADVTFDVDVDPINNQAFVTLPAPALESDVDAAGGVLQFPFDTFIQDMDGSETILSAVLRNVPSFLTVYVPDPSNPTGPKIPALLSAINPGSTLDWSLSDEQWLGAELRGFPKDFAGDLPILVDVSTQEANGGIGTTNLTTIQVRIEEVIDGGDPSETVNTNEDQAVQIVLDGNLTDLTVESPEFLQDAYTIFDVEADAAGRTPQFFDGPPNQVGTTPGGDPIYDNLLTPDANGRYDITAAIAPNLFVLPGQDSSDNVVFKVLVTYEEQEKPGETTDATGTVTVRVKGVADTPDVAAQDATPSGPINTAAIATEYLRDVPGGAVNSDPSFAYAYAGFENSIFQLDQRVSDAALTNGFVGDPDPFVAADVLSGNQNEITFGNGLPDGSEALYYIITGDTLGSDIRLVGGTPVDATGTSYVVPAANISNVSIFAAPTAGVPAGDVVYHDLTINAIVTERDADLSGLPDLASGATVDQVLTAIDARDGGSVSSADFSIMVLSNGGGGSGPPPCPPGSPEALIMPSLSLVGVGFEDTANEFKITLNPDGVYWDSIDDLTTLPNGVIGDFGFGLTPPPGGTLSSTVPGALLFDPLTGQYVVDFAVLGTDPLNPLQTAGAIIYTPPADQSTLPNPFAASETFGADDPSVPYDSLPPITTNAVLNNFTCNTFLDQQGSLPVDILPVVDGPTITIAALTDVPEDTEFAAGISISGRDGGERVTGDVVVTISGDPGARLVRGGVEITPDAGSGSTPTYTLSPADLANLDVRTTEHFSGEITLNVTASSEDIDNSVASSSTTRTIAITPVADTPQFVYSTDPTLVTNPTDPVPIVTLREDVPGIFGDIFTTAATPDQDGSETASAVIGPLPDYVVLTGAPGIINNGDGTFTIPASQLSAVSIALVDTHARTPDALDPLILDDIPVSLTINTLELANSDKAEATTNFILRVVPDADKPTVTADVAPTSGVEDDGTRYDITLTGETPDPHETLSFEVTIPADSTLFVDGVAQAQTPNNTYVIAGVPDPAYTGTGAGFIPGGAVSFVPAANVAGALTLEAVAISTDSALIGGFTDTERSDMASEQLVLAVAPDLVLQSIAPTIDQNETEAAITFKPIDNLVFDLSDNDGSEVFTSLNFTITDLPVGATYDIGGGPVAASGTLTLPLTETQLRDLEIALPADFATSPGQLQVTVSATTNEGGNETATFGVGIIGELDATLAVAAPATVTEQAGSSLVVPVDIMAQITDTQSVPSETWQRVTMTFASPLPAATVLSAGVLAADGLSILFDPGTQTAAAFEASLTAFTMTLPDGFDDVIQGSVTAETNHGITPAVSFTTDVNAQPDVSGPVNLGPFDATNSFDVSFADLLANSTDADNLTVENVTTVDPDVQVVIAGTNVTVTVPDGYAGTPELVYDVVDDSAQPARSEARATLDIDTLQMVADSTPGQDPTPAGTTLLTDTTGDPAFGTMAKGTDAADYVEVSAARPYAGITEFQLAAEDDVFVDLRTATNGTNFIVNGGAGNDLLSGSGSGPSLTLVGGTGVDTLVGGSGSDTFVLEAGSLIAGETDIISNYDLAGQDSIDLTQEVSGSDDITGIVDYDNTTGLLSVNGLNAFQVADTSAAIPAQVEVMFEDSAGAAQIAVI
ncbi:MAG: hypothetical protein AB8B58_08295 [Roseobacter sp.]